MHTVRVSTLVGTVNNSGLIDDTQLSFQFGTVNNEAGGEINTSYTLSTMGSRFINSTVFDNHGTVTNEATIDNEGIFNNYGTCNNTGGTFDNQGTFNAYCGSTLLGAISGNPVNEIPCNTAPVVDAGEDQTVNEGDAVSLDPSTFSDADVTDSHTATISWGDTSPTEPGIISESAGSGTVSGTHTYTDDGIYTVTVCVADDEVEACDSLIVTVNDLGPTAALTGDAMLDEGQVGSYDASASTSSLDAIVAYEWDWDYDGGTFHPSGDTGITQSHAWNDNGTYSVAVRITDDDSSTDIATFSVTVGNLPPEVNAGLDKTINLGDTVLVNAEFSDSGIADTHTATIFWGDGSSEPGAVSESAGSGTVAGNHNYAWPGLYNVTVEVTDDDGDVGRDVFTIEVLPVPEVMVEILRSDVDAIDLPKGTENSLNASLDTAMKKLVDSNPKNDVAAINALEAFINKIEAQRGKKISDGDADVLIAKAQDIIAALSGGT